MEKKLFEAPEVKVVEVKPRSIIAQSCASDTACTCDSCTTDTWCSYGAPCTNVECTIQE